MFKVLLSVVILVSVTADLIAEEANEKSNIIKWAATIDICSEMGLIKKEHISEELYPRTRYWVYKNLTDKEKAEFNDLISAKKDKIKDVTEEKCEDYDEKIMALPFPGREMFGDIKADTEKVRKELDEILGACKKLIPALRNLYLIREGETGGEKKNEAIKNKINEYFDVAIYNSGVINETLSDLKQDGRLPYLFVNNDLREDYHTYSSRKLVDRLQGDKKSLIENSFKLSVSVCENLK